MKINEEKRVIANDDDMCIWQKVDNLVKIVEE